MAELIKGNKALAARLGVSVRTVQQWRKEGLLRDATVSDYRRTIIYQLDKALRSLRNASPGWPERASGCACTPDNQPK